jgi:hypothetical protein
MFYTSADRGLGNSVPALDWNHDDPGDFSGWRSGVFDIDNIGEGSELL